MRSVDCLPIVAVILCIVLVSATPIDEVQYQRQCSLQPNNWCDNLSNAKDCHATKFCLQNVWEKRLVPVDQNYDCQMCKDMIERARALIPCDNCNEKIEHIFKASCKQLPDKKMQLRCTEITKNNLPALLELLMSKLNSEQICTLMELCNEKSPLETNQNVDQLTCTSCNQLALTLKENFELIEPNKMIENMLDICYSLDTLSDACFNIAAYYFDDLYMLAKQYLQSNDICRAIDICPNAVSEPKAVILPAITNEDIMCTECKKMVRLVRESILKGSTESQFKKKLNDLCIKWHGAKAQCKLLVDEYYHVVYIFLKSGVNDVSMCRKINLCPKPHKAEDMKMPASKLEIKLLDTNHSENAISSLSSNCNLCESVIMNLRKLSVAKIAMEHVCYLLDTKDLVQQCWKMLQQHFDSIEELVMSNKGQQEICRDLNMCLLYETQNVGNVGESLDYLPGNNEKFNVAELQPDGVCIICKTVLNLMKTFINTATKRNHLIHKIYKICSIMPSSYRTMCKTMTTTYSNMAVDLLNNIPPQQICQMVHFCITKEQYNEFINSMQSLSVEYDEGPIQWVCNFLLTKIKGLVNTQKKRNYIINTMQFTCDLLPNIIRNQCDLFVNTFVRMTLNLLSNIHPKEICSIVPFYPGEMDSGSYENIAQFSN